MTVYKKFGVALITALSLVFILAIWYTYEYAMKEVKSMEINASNLEHKILIATQGSEFKDKVTLNLTEYYQPQSVFIKVVDAKSLETLVPEEFDAIIVIHTWEYGKPPKEVRSFIERNEAYKDKIVILATSGEGSYKMDAVDALAGESILQNASAFSTKIISKVDAILAKNTTFKIQEK